MWYEYIAVTLAAALAGIGTGLVGLSAATAMVPLEKNRYRVCQDRKG